jgi:hypothetical protein
MQGWYASVQGRALVVVVWSIDCLIYTSTVTFPAMTDAPLFQHNTTMIYLLYVLNHVYTCKDSRGAFRFTAPAMTCGLMMQIFHSQLLNYTKHATHISD